MTPEFAKAVDPIFLHVFGLMERLGRGTPRSVEDERAHIKALIDQADAMWGQTPDGELAKYAIVSWIDEMLIIDVPSQYTDWWKNNALEWEYFNSNIRSEEFYARAKLATSLRRKDALEVFYVCVVMGFRGLYRDLNRAAAFTDALQIPPDKETWARQTAMGIQLRLGRPPISEATVPIEGAPPLDGPFSLISVSLAGLILTVSTGLVAGLSFLK